MSENNNPTQYWATIQDPEQLLSELTDKTKYYYDDLRGTGVLGVMERSFRAYYGGKVQGSYTGESLFGGSRLSIGGKQGEKTNLKVNHFRNLIRHFHQLTTAQKPAMQAKATNTDYKSQAQTLLANGLLDFYWREKNVARTSRDAAETALVYLEAFVHAPWNPTAGEEYSVDEGGRPIYEGDQEYYVKTPLDIVRDPSLRGQNDTWRIVLDTVNRWDMAAKYPAHYEEILACSAVDPQQDQIPSFQLRTGNDPINHDLIRMGTFYHNKTEAMPEGRLVIYVANAIVFDGPLPYQEMPVYRLAESNIDGTIYGYGIAADLLSIQGGIDELHTILMSNNKTFGMQSIWNQKGNGGVTVNQLSGGMRVLESEVKPEPLQLTASSAESYNYLAILENGGELMSGVSSTVRGQPEASLKSGTALAMVVSQSIQFASSFEEAYYRLVEDLGTALIFNLRDFSQTKRVANIVGESSRPFAKEFVASEDLDSVNRVVCDTVSAMSKTVAGRAQIAQDLLANGMIENAKQYIMVLTTGQLDPAIEGTQHALLNVRAENEEMREGRPVVAVITENHMMHVQEHKSIIENPEAKTDPEFIARVLAHIQEHVDLWTTASPAILAMTGQMPPPMPPMPAGVPGASGVMDNASPTEQVLADAPQANLPSLPENAPPQTPDPSAMV